MVKVGIVRDPLFRAHQPPLNHPEQPGRIVAIEDLLDASGLSNRLVPVEAPPASDEQLTRVHDLALIRQIRRAATEARSGPVSLDADTYVSPRSPDAARRASGGMIRLVDLVLAGELTAGFCVPRPPGHHATRSAAMGFCLFNHVAVAAAHALDTGRVERLAIIDIDVHHGNGTQDAFYDDPRVLYISTHQHPHYPGTGHAHETGAGAARGTTLNLPMPAGCGDAEHLRVMDAAVVPALNRFRPQLLLISAGFDAHWRDPLSAQTVSGAGFRAMAERIRRVAMDHDVPVVTMLEGGYDPEAIAWGFRHFVDVALDRPPAEDAVGPCPHRAPSHADEIERLLTTVTAMHGLRTPAQT